MQWTGEKDAGFCPKGAHEGPWVAVNPNHVEVNVAAEDDDLMSPLSFYRRAIRLRRLLPVVRSGRYHEFKRASTKLYVYARESTWSRLLVMCSFSDEPVTFHVPDTYGDLGGGVLALSNYYVTDAEADDANQLTLRPWETRAYVFGRDAVLVD
jgi:oligo-1,6-glucosidase